MNNAHKKKIALVITQGEMGGAAQYVADVAIGTNDDNRSITIAHGEKQPEWLSTWADAQKIPFHFLKHVKRNISPLHDVLAFFELKKFFKKEQFDIVHLNSNKIGILGALAAKKAGIKKVIFTAHGWAFDDPRPAWERKLYIMLNKFFMRYIDTVIAVSEYAKQSAFAVGIDTEKFRIIHNGIDPLTSDLYQTREHAKKFLHDTYDVNVTQFLIGTIANYYPTKGVLYLLQAINEIVIDNPQYHFCIIGKGEQEQAIREYIKERKLQQHISLIKDLPQARRVLTAFDVFVLPSVKECYPYVILEAMSTGLPIVATHVGGIPEALKQYPKEQYTLVPAKDPSTMAQAIKENVTKLKLPQERIAEVMEKIGKKKMIEKTKEVY
ncbi:MAG: glycosyltransferase [Patescibacteria group bacterium]